MDTTFEKARAAYGTGAYDDATLEFLFPQLKESEDERIRKEIIEFIQWSEDRGMTRHDFHQAKRPSEWIAYLEKQKEQKPHLELKTGKWYICHRAFCARADHLTVKEGERFQCEKDGIVKGFVIKEPEKYFKECSAPEPMEKEPKPAEWSEDDEKMLRTIISDGSRGVELDSKQIDWLQSLRPSWKPSEEQPEVDLNEEVKRYYSENFEYLSSDSPTLSILTNIARHFYELALTQERRTSK